MAPRQIGRYISSDAVGEILLFGVTPQIGKGQHRRWSTAAVQSAEL